jgi:hypothetical protein
MAKEVRAVLFSEAEVGQVLQALTAAGIRRDQVRVEAPSPQQARSQVKSKQKSWKKSALYGLILGVIIGLLIGLIGGQGAMKDLGRPVNADFGQVVWLVIASGLFFAGFGALLAVGMNKLAVSPVNESSGAQRPVMVISAESDEQAAAVNQIITKSQAAAPIDPTDRKR